MSDKRVFRTGEPLVAPPAVASNFTAAMSARREEQLDSVIAAERQAVEAKKCPIAAYVATTLG